MRERIIKGFGTLEQRAYLLLSLAVGGLGASPQRQAKAVRLWRIFVSNHPRFKSPLISEFSE